MDISFTCDQCGQNVVIDEAGAGMSVQCPNCGVSLKVPGLRADKGQPNQPGRQPSTDSFFLCLEDRVCGPFTKRTMRCKVLSGRLDVETPCSRAEGDPRLKVRNFDEVMEPYEHAFDEEALKSLLRIPAQPTYPWVRTRLETVSRTLQFHQDALNEVRTVSALLMASNDILRIMEEFLIYERLDFKTTTPPPSLVIADLIGYRDERIVRCLKLECADREQKLSGLVSSKARANSMLKLLGTIEKYRVASASMRGQ